MRTIKLLETKVYSGNFIKEINTPASGLENNKTNDHA